MQSWLIKKIHRILNYLVKCIQELYSINIFMLVYMLMEAFSAEDVFVGNVSFKLNKGSSCVTDRRSVHFYPSGSNIYKTTSGNRVIKIFVKW